MYNTGVPKQMSYYCHIYSASLKVKLRFGGQDTKQCVGHWAQRIQIYGLLFGFCLI